MNTPKGKVTVRGNRVQLVRGADVPGHRWSGLIDQIGPLAVGSDDEVVVLSGEHLDRLPTLLQDWPASTIQWEWTATAQTAVGAADGRSTEVRNIARLGVPTGWPDGTPGLEELGIRRPLTPEQLRDVAHLLHLGNGGNFSVPGAGKTAAMYVVWSGLRALGVVDGLLVLAPASSFEAWSTEPEELFIAGRRPRVQVRPIIPDRRADVVVLNYEQLEQGVRLSDLKDWIQARRACVVFDESHRVKAGAEGVRGAACRRLAGAAVRRFVLSGTPMPNSHKDLEAQIDLCWPGLGRRIVSGDLRPALRNFYVRTTKDELHLPPLEVVVESVGLDPAHRESYEELIHSEVREWRAGRRSAGATVLQMIRAASDPRAGGAAVAGYDAVPAKLLRAAEIARANAALGRKTVIWSCFIDVVHNLVASMPDLEPACVIGSVPVEDPTAVSDRRRQIERFRTDESCWVLVATPQTLGEGVSLHHTARDQVHVDRTFSAGAFLQALDRTHRLGMDTGKPARATVLIAEDTVDNRVHEVLRRKTHQMAAALRDRSLHILALGVTADSDDESEAVAFLQDLPPLVS